MMRLFFVAGIVLTCFLAAFAQQVEIPDRFSSLVEKHWLLGKKNEVLQVAENRLKQNPNDLASLLITLDYAGEFMELDRMRAVIPRVRAVAAGISSPTFATRKSLLSATLEVFEQVLPTITPAMVKAEAHKGHIKYKPLSTLLLIQDLEADGLVPRATPQEQALLEGQTRVEPTSPGATPIDSLRTPADPQTIAVPPITPTPMVRTESTQSRRFPIVGVAILAGILAVAVYLWRRSSH